MLTIDTIIIILEAKKNYINQTIKSCQHIRSVRKKRFR